MDFRGMWSDVKAIKPPPDGEWALYAYGQDHRCWVLNCGAVFNAQITMTAGRYYATLNGQPVLIQGDLREVQNGVERLIVQHVRAMNTGYRAVLQRVKMNTGPVAIGVNASDKERTSQP